MAMLSSCTTLLSRAPALAPGKILSRRRSAAPQQTKKVMGLRRESQCRRAALFTCHAYDIQPNALVHPREKNDGDWRLKEEEGDQITLKFMVGKTSKEELKVETTEDQTLLLNRYKKDEKKEEDKSKSSSPASSLDLDVRLLMPPGYESNKMQAMLLSNGWLEISIPKPKNKPQEIKISQPPA